VVPARVADHEAVHGGGYRTFAVAEALAFSVNVQVFLFCPLLLQAPDQMTSRLFVAESVIDVPTGKVAVRLWLIATSIPTGLERTLSPPRPVAVTVRVAVPPPPQTFGVPPPPQI
jgi:hypothetical protein